MIKDIILDHIGTRHALVNRVIKKSLSQPDDACDMCSHTSVSTNWSSCSLQNNFVCKNQVNCIFPGSVDNSVDVKSFRLSTRGRILLHEDAAEV